MGIEIQKEWVCTHDDRTRPSHLELDGERRDLDEEFSNGLQYPGDPDGDPSEVYNCRCTLVAYLPGIDQDTEGTSAEGYDEWKKESAGDQELTQVETQSTELKASSRDCIVEKEAIKQCSTDSFNKRAENWKHENKKTGEVTYPLKGKYNPVHRFAEGQQPTEEQIIKTLGGKDYTGGSCQSQALAFIGQEFGIAVEDYAGGASMEIFQFDSAIQDLVYKIGKGFHDYSFTPLEDFWPKIKATLNAKTEDGKQWILAAGKHTAIVKRTGKTYKYLELQEYSFVKKGTQSNGWHPLTEKSLHDRFDVFYTTDYGQTITMIPVESLKDCEELISRLGWLNTADYAKYYGKIVGGTT